MGQDLRTVKAKLRVGRGHKLCDCSMCDSSKQANDSRYSGWTNVAWCSGDENSLEAGVCELRKVNRDLRQEISAWQPRAGHMLLAGTPVRNFRGHPTTSKLALSLDQLRRENNQFFALGSSRTEAERGIRWLRRIRRRQVVFGHLCWETRKVGLKGA